MNTADGWQRVASALRARREELHLSRDDAVARSGVSKSTWYELERAGKARYQSKKLIAVAKALGWPEDAVTLILDEGATVEELNAWTPTVLPEQSAPTPITDAVNELIADQVAPLREEVRALREEFEALRRAVSLVLPSDADVEFAVAAQEGDLEPAPEVRRPSPAIEED